MLAFRLGSILLFMGLFIIPTENSSRHEIGILVLGVGVALLWRVFSGLRKEQCVLRQEVDALRVQMSALTRVDREQQNR